MQAEGPTGGAPACAEPRRATGVARPASRYGDLMPGVGHAKEGERGGSHRRLAVVAGLLGSLLLAELVVGIVSNSLVLLADAGHLLADVGAVAAAIWATRLAGRPAGGRWSFGLERAEVLAAAANGLSLFVVGVVIVAFAVARLIRPSPVEGLPVVVMAGAGVLVDLVATALLARPSSRSLNLRAVFLHIATDLAAYAATAVAGVLILEAGLRRADALAALVIAVLVILAAWSVLRESGRILLEGTPDSLDVAAVRAHLLEMPEVCAVHDLHAWSVGSSLPVLTAHVVVTDACLAEGRGGTLLDRLQACLAGHFDVEHSTLQIEPPNHRAHEPLTHA